LDFWFRDYGFRVPLQKMPISKKKNAYALTGRGSAGQG
jgi:hypothetical protein